MAKQAKEHKPKMIIGGFPLYPDVDWAKQRTADSIGAYLLVDMAHVAGLIAAVYPNPVPAPLYHHHAQTPGNWY